MFAIFEKHLNSAWQQLERAMVIAPDDPDLWALCLKVLIGIGDDPLVADGRRSYDALLARNACAFSFHALGMSAPAVKELEVVGAAVALKPWVHCPGGAYAGVQRARAELGMRALVGA